MVKQHVTACLVAAGLMTGSALAQTGPAPAAPPATPAPAPPGAAPAAPGAAQGPFITEQSINQWRASKFVGVDVYGTDNAKIGDVREILVNRDGVAEAVVIGVGGFLGIGEKEVAVPFKQLEWVSEPSPTAQVVATRPPGPMADAPPPGAGPRATTGTMASGTAPSGTAPSGMAPSGTAPSGTATPGAAPSGPAAGPTSSAATTEAARPVDATIAAASRGYPNRAVLRMTRADLEKAPAFSFIADMRTTTTVPGGGMGSPVPLPRP